MHVFFIVLHVSVVILLVIASILVIYLAIGLVVLVYAWVFHRPTMTIIPDDVAEPSFVCVIGWPIVLLVLRPDRKDRRRFSKTTRKEQSCG